MGVPGGGFIAKGGGGGGGTALRLIFVRVSKLSVRFNRHLLHPRGTGGSATGFATLLLRFFRLIFLQPGAKTRPAGYTGGMSVETLLRNVPGIPSIPSYNRPLVRPPVKSSPPVAPKVPITALPSLGVRGGVPGQGVLKPAATPPKVVTKVELEAELCRESFYDFFLRFWGTVSDEKLVNNWHIEFLCDELQVVAERVFKRQPKEYDLIINIAPGSTKSIICSVLFPVWLWVRQPGLRAICASYTLDLAFFLGTQSRMVAQSEKFRELFPEIKLQSEALGIMMTNRNGQRIAAGVGGRIMGLHSHLIVIDDPINPKDAISEAGINEANRWFDNTIPSRMVAKTLTPIILVMQRLAEDDPTGHMLSKVGRTPIRHICIPAELEGYGELVRPRSLRAKYVDGLFDPVRLPRYVLREIEADGAYAYAGQYGQNPIPARGGLFNGEMLNNNIQDTPPHLPFKTVRFWDKAGTGSGKGAYTVGVKMCKDRQGKFWVLDVIRGRWEASEREKVIRATAVADGRGVMVGVEQEPGSGGKESAQATVLNLAGFGVWVDRPVGDKATRADPYATQVNAGNVYLLKAAWNRAYIDELRHFPLGKYKDQVDASTAGFAKLANRLRVGGF